MKRISTCLKRLALLARRLALAAAVCTLVGSVAIAAGTTFELEDPSIANIKDDAGNGPDWASLFDVPDDEEYPTSIGYDDTVPEPKATLPDGIFAAGFYRDFLFGKTSDNTTFTTGTKDIQNISGGGLASGEWQCKKKSNVSDKGDVLNAYATIYEHNNQDGDVILAMGIERASDNGTSKVGFWFLQDDTIACDTSGGKAQTFIGNHLDGDLLVIVDFEQGGNNPTPKVYEWRGDAATGALVLIDDTGVTCTAGTDQTCATTNQSGTLLHSAGDPPWLTQTKTSGPNFSPDLMPLMFFEAQVNLTDLGIQRCFNKFMPNTRQSASVTATVFDYLLGDFDVCSFSANKTCTSASVATGGTQVDYTFAIRVKNTGIAPIDVTVAEQTAGCSVVDPSTSLEPGLETTFSVSCPNLGLDPVNEAEVSARFYGELISTETVSADDTACPLNVTSDIALTSACDEVVLVDTGARIGLDATISGVVEAPADESGVEALTNVTLNVYDTGCTGDIALCTPVQTTLIDDLLIPGEGLKSWSHSYAVAIGDNTSSSECASSANFRRGVIAFGTGAISGDPYFSNLVETDPEVFVPMPWPVDCRPCIDCSNTP